MLGKEFEMKLTLLADIHNRPIGGSEIESDIKSSDIVIVAGDLTTFSGYKNAELIISQLKSLNNAIAAIAGNCDSYEVVEAMEDYSVSVDQKSVTYCGLQVMGISGVENSRFHGVFYDKLKTAYAKINPDIPFVLVSHQPASATLVSDRGGYDGGNCGIRKFITQYKPVLAVSGHMHEARAKDIIGSTVLVNPGAYAQGHYATVEIDLPAAKVTKVQFKEC